MSMRIDQRIEVSVVYAPAAREVREVTLWLAPASTVMQAIQASGFLQLFPSIDLQAHSVGIWGQKTSLDQALRQHDRVELYRPLRVDPKTARRERFAQQGARSAGLFVKKRPGAKAGY